MSKMHLKRMFNTDWIEIAASESDLYQSVQELKEASDNPKVKGIINWDIWDRVVEETRLKLNDVKTSTKVEKDRATKPLYVYNFDGQQIGWYTSVKEAEIKLKVSKSTIYTSAINRKPYYQGRMVFSYTRLQPQEVKAMIKRNIPVKKQNNITDTNGKRIVHVDRYVYDLSGNFIGYFNSSIEAAEALGITRNAVNYYVFIGKPYKKEGLVIRNTPMEKSSQK